MGVRTKRWMAQTGLAVLMITALTAPPAQAATLDIDDGIPAAGVNWLWSGWAASNMTGCMSVGNSATNCPQSGVVFMGVFTVAQSNTFPDSVRYGFNFLEPGTSTISDTLDVEYDNDIRQVIAAFTSDEGGGVSALSGPQYTEIFTFEETGGPQRLDLLFPVLPAFAEISVTSFVPEPDSLLLVGFGLAALAAARRRRQI